MNILEHDCEEKFYHEYGSSKISRGGRSNEEDTTSTSTSSSSISSSSVLTSFNGLHSSIDKDYRPEFHDEICASNTDNSCGTSGSNNKEHQEIEIASPAIESPRRMDSGISFKNSSSSGVSNNLLLDDGEIHAIEGETDRESSSSVFNCGHCGRASFQNGEFETIKLGDIFTQITQFPSSSEGTHEGPRLCAQCLSSRQGLSSGSSTVHNHNNIQNFNANLSSSNNNRKNTSNGSVVVTSTSVVDSATTTTNSNNSSTISSVGGSEDDRKTSAIALTGEQEQRHVEGSGQFLQGVSTIIMQNASNQHHHHHQVHQFQQQQNLQSPPPPSAETQAANMHHDHQQQHFYQQQSHLMPQQVKMESDSMIHSQQAKIDSDTMAQSHPPQSIKMETDSIDHSQQQHQSLQHFDTFILPHESAMYSNSNDNLQQQQHLHQDHQTTMVSFDEHNNMHQIQQRQQVICDNQQQQHQSAMQHITVVTPGSDIKYTIPTAIMQIQGKDQGGVDQGQGQQQLIQFSSSGQNHLISLSQHSNGSGGGGLANNDANSTNTNSGSGNPGGVFQFLDMTTLPDSKNTMATLMTTSIVTPPSTTSSVSSTPTIMPANAKSSTKPRSNKNNNETGADDAASGSSGAKTSKKAKNSNNPEKPETPKIPCDLCKKKFKNPKMATNHYKRVHQKEPRFICEICGAVFSYRDSLDCHQVSHRPQEKTHDCGKCGMKFSTKANLRSHAKTHTENPKKFPCEFCTSGFSKRVNLRYHIKRKHPEEAEKMNNNNNSKDNLPGSLINLTGVPPPVHQAHGTVPLNPDSIASPGDGIAGAVGGAETGDNSKDKNQGSFKCDQCGRGFLFKNNLKAHLRTHARDKKYTCETCGKSFIYKESLKNHMLLHSNELPYLCDICGKKFRDRSNRRKHVKNVHKYLFVNGDINNPLKPGAAAAPGAVPGQPGSSTAGGPAASSTQPGEPPTKKRKNSKKATQELTGELGSSQDGASNKPRNIIKSPAAPRGKKAKNANVPAAAGAATATQAKPATATSNAKSVIVSASTTSSTVGIDRKIIMSPSPKTPKSSSGVSSPNSLDYVHSHSSLPVTVHVPLAGSGQGQFSHGGRNIIVKAPLTASSIVPPNHHQSPPALSPEMYHHQQQQHSHSRGSVSMQQNVIVYPKPKVIPDHPQYPSSSPSVISQTMQQAQHQYYISPDQHLHSQQQQQQQPPQGYSSYLQLTPHNHQQQPSPVQSSLMPPSHLSSPNPSAFEYVLSSTNLSSQSQDSRGSDPSGGGGPTQSHHPYGGGGHLAPDQGQMEIQLKSEYSHHFYPPDPNAIQYEQQHYHHWASAPPGMDHGGGGHPPTSSSPYQLVATPVGSNGSNSSGLVSEGAHPQHPSNSLAQSYDSGGMNPPSNALSPEGVYAQGASAAAQGHEVLDPSGNGGNFFYKDFDFSYL